MILQIKDKGTLVLILQEKLNLELDGIFGADTEKAVKEFQHKNKLRADGIAGDKTLELLGLNFSRYVKNGTDTDVSWELPESGVGFKTYNRELRGDQFGTKSTIQNCIDIAKEWSLIHPEIKIQFGDISLLYGGNTPDHATHEKGKDVDIRPMRADFQYAPITYQDSKYSRSLTREFLKLVKGKVRGVYFNDPVLIKEGLCKHAAGHSNHLHIMF